MVIFLCVTVITNCFFQKRFDKVDLLVWIHQKISAHSRGLEQVELGGESHISTMHIMYSASLLWQDVVQAVSGCY